ncbi:MAG: arginine--tRNA ligase [Alphaproteobacteria bacterium]|nr:arginine--tRNA ligase [Alphaproteobacteria bacterium]
MNVFHFFKEAILTVVQTLIQAGHLPSGLDLERITVDPPKETGHGDLATNAAMVLAKPAEKNPKELAKLMVEHFEQFENVQSVEIAGPGFINFVLKPEFWQKRLLDVLQSGTSYGDGVIGHAQKINVEYVSANPTGPMHTGHGRNAVLGDVIAALLQKVGYAVCREYYVNDAGGQIDALARSVYLRYREALGHPLHDSDFQEGMYGADYLIPVGQELATLKGDLWVDQPEATWIEEIRRFSVDAMMNLIRNDLEALGIHMDVFTSEKKLVDDGAVENALKVLEEKGDLYIGTLERPKGHDIGDWEPRPQTLFRATAYGDDVDRPLKKSDGSWTYFASDIAYHFDKFCRGYTQMIDVLGADHGGYVKRIQAATSAVTKGQGHAEVKTCQMVNFLDNGVPLKMSKRAGTFIKLRDVIDRVGKDVTRFIMLTRRNDMGIDFDFAKVIEQTKDNPVFYVQYAHARVHSVLRHGLELFPGSLDDLSKIDVTLLTDVSELEMIKLLASWPRQVEVAALVREPHRIAYFLQDVAAAFHGLWNKGKEQTHLRFIDTENQKITTSRLALAKGTATVIASGLALFGIIPLEEMR